MKGAESFSFDLDERMLGLLGEEFDVEKLTARFAQAIANKKGEEIEKTGKEIFDEHGRNWMKRTLQLGEEHPDRTYEVLKAAAARTGALTFPHVPQRFIEIAYLSTHGMSALPIVENNARRLVYKIIRCKTFDTLKEKCGEEVANLLLCRHACLAALESLFENLNMDVKLDMEASLIKEGYCQFAAQKI